MADRSSSIRLFVDSPFSEGGSVILDNDQAHYLFRVMRLGVGARIHVFNGKDGEWVAAIEEIDKRRAQLRVHERHRPQATEPDIWLAFAPVKKARTDYIVEKAVELGAAKLMPVITEFTDTQRVNVVRLAATARESAEQCDRLSLAIVEAACPLDNMLAAWPRDRRLFLLDETGGGAPPMTAFASSPSTIGFVTGPEGGFSKRELDLMRGLDFVTGISLGPRILRAETAAVAALASFQAMAGDWR